MSIVTICFVGRAGDLFHGAHATLAERSCLDQTADLASMVRRGTKLSLSVYDSTSGHDYEWRGEATGEPVPCSVARQREEDERLAERARAVIR